MTYSEICDTLQKSGVEDAEWEAALLLEHFCGVEKTMLRAQPNRDFSAPLLLEALDRRRMREPLQYILGEWEFYRQTYEVTPDCLIPRSDTEILVEEAIRLLPKNALFADVCTGSGCIAISTLAERLDTRGIAVDISLPVLEITTKNAKKNGVFDRILIEQIDILSDEEQSAQIFSNVDAILSNPPYIKTNVLQSLSPEVKKEPMLALDGGADGLVFYRRLIELAKAHLKPEGFCLFEIGFDQAEALRELALSSGFSCNVRKDYGGNDRVVLLRRI